MTDELNELNKIYDPALIENDIYQQWLADGAFNADAEAKAASFCMVIPPPNVTAPLHLGHALNNTLQDVLIRFKRMEQFNTLWLPGTDHAGIATQTVVEKESWLRKASGGRILSVKILSRRVQEWKDQYTVRIIEQLKLMGCSCDWQRTRFTMDEVCAKAVRAAFFKLFADGLIYRGKRLVNWDPATQTVLADDEVEHETIAGNFWYLRYPLVEPTEAGGEKIRYITVATTRPETMLGDTAVAMNPRDKRAKALIGKKVRLPLVGRIIPIIADEHVVAPDPDSEDPKAKFSTGFLKVTPAHDPDDYAIGLRHDLPMINVMAPDGSISDQHGWDDASGTEAEAFLGMDRFEARAAIVEWFRVEKLLEDVRQYDHPVGHSYRSHVPIEPYLSDQWYIAVKKQISHLSNEGTIEGTDVPVNSLAGLALKPILDEKLKFVPPRYADTYRSWLENLRDWPISRQLWWGHQIPIWSHAGKTSVDAPPEQICLQTAQLDDGTAVTYASVSPGCEELEKQLLSDGWQRDPDVLDTWFSSALWPFSTLGWPDSKAELATFYPGNVLCTAREIITLWVSRMVMMGQYCLGDVPFTDVFIHAMIQDGQGRKMSKSLGNGIDPLDIIDSHGADAMRFTLVSMTTQTQDVRMPVEQMTLPDGRVVNSSPKFDFGRNLCNKLWNASRFTLMNIQGLPAWGQIRPGANLSDVWILSRLNETVRDATVAVESYRFNELADTLYHFMWNDFCDWYLEIAKARINSGDAAPKAILAHCLDVLLRLMHPIIPFITEAIWHKLNAAAPHRSPGDVPAEQSLVRAAWPRADGAAINQAAARWFTSLQELIRGIRNIRLEHNVTPSTKISLSVEAASQFREIIGDNVDLIKSQAGVEKLEFRNPDDPIPDDSSVVVFEGVKLYVLDIVDKQAQQARLTKQAQTLAKGISGIEANLTNENFLAKAPEDVVKARRQKLEILKADLAKINESLEAFA